MAILPDVIYLQGEEYSDEGVTWCVDQINDTDTAYTKNLIGIDTNKLVRSDTVRLLFAVMRWCTRNRVRFLDLLADATAMLHEWEEAGGDEE